MNKKKLMATAAVAIMTISGFNVSRSMNDSTMSDVALENVEALASGEGSGSCNWGTREVWQGWQAICIAGGAGYSCTCGEVKDYF
jgi:hypothetical protein